MPPPDPAEKMGSEAARAWFDRHFEVVCVVIDGVARRYRLHEDELKRFPSYGYERVLENDFRMIRAYSRRASTRTYLTVVLTNVYRDFCIRRTGKFRASAEARRLGPESRRGERMAECRRALREALDELPAQDREILELHLWEGRTLAAVSRDLNLEQKPLYRRVKAAYRRLRAHLEAKGFGGDEVREFLP
jgi:RNA polymerase sigma factor (sigma-70 family)